MDIENEIRAGKIDWKERIDENNHFIHSLAYQQQINFIKLFPPEQLSLAVAFPNSEGDTVCHIGAKLHHLDLVDLSLSVNPSVIYQMNESKHTPLYYLVSYPELVQKILDQRKIMDHYIDNHRTLLEYYLVSENLSMVQFLHPRIQLTKYSDGILVSLISSSLDTQYKLKAARLILSFPFDVNKFNRHFVSPLIVAIKQGDEQMTRFLLEKGADINYCGLENLDNPLTLAILESNEEMIQLLMEYQPDLTIRDKFLRTPIHYLFSSPLDTPDRLVEINISTRVKRLLLTKINSVNTCNNRMNSILNLLMQNDNWKNYQDLLEDKKLKIYLKNKNGWAPIDFVDKNELIDFYQMVYRSYLKQLDRGKEWEDVIDQLIAQGGHSQHYQGYLIQKIINGQSYPVTKKKIKIKMLKAPETNITHFSAYVYNYVCFLCYLLKKYPNVKIPVLPEQLKKRSLTDIYVESIQDFLSTDDDDSIFRSIISDHLNHGSCLINHIIIWRSDQKYFISPYLAQAINQTLYQYPDVDYLLLKLTILTKRRFNHANIILFDVKKKKVERFDPYGKVPFIDNKAIDDFLLLFFHHHFPGTHYLSYPEICHTISFQVFSDEANISNYVENDPVGFCIVWCIWWVETRIKNKDIDIRRLASKMVYLINKSYNKFKDYIRHYSHYLDGEKNKILEKCGVPYSYWYAKRLPMLVHKKYLKNIRKIFHHLI